MKRVIRVLGYWAIIFSLLFLSSITFAQEGTIESTTEIAQIPAVRIIDWKGETPTVNGLDGWQEQALKVNDKVCCPMGQAGHDFVLVALNRYSDNLVRLSPGTCLTIKDIEGNSAIEISQDSGEALFDLGVLEEGSSFIVDAPDATIGVSGTTFNVIVDTETHSSELEVLDVDSGCTVTVDDKNPDAALGDSDTTPIPEYTLGSNQKLTVIRGAANVGPDFLKGERSAQHGKMKQMMGEIAAKSKGEKKGFYKDEDVEDVEDDEGDEGDKSRYLIHD